MNVLRRRTVAEKCGVSASTIDRWSHEDRFVHLGFPRPFKLADQAVGFDEEEIEAWIASRAAQRDAPAA